jgi:MFS family permease
MNPILSTMMSEFPDNKETYVSYIQMGGGFGGIVGPFLTAIIYPSFDYAYTNVFFGSLVWIFAFIPICFLKVKSD